MANFGNSSYIEFSTEFDKTGMISCLYSSPNKACHFLSKNVSHQQYPSKHTCTHSAKLYDVDTGGSIINMKVEYLLTYHTIARVHSAKTNVYTY